jgi:D-amino peptidase
MTSHHQQSSRGPKGRSDLFACLAALMLVPGLCQAQRPLKVYISADMEGVAGVVSAEQLGPAGFEYGRFREFMTAEVLAAIQGARDAGATTIVVGDSHGNGQNLLIERFSGDITIVRSWPRPLMMMEGIDSSFAAAVFIGYHASTNSMTGVRAHTMSSATLTSVELNGVAVPEGGFNAAIAGHFGVPVVAVSGDDAAVAELQKLVGPMEGAVVKRAISFHAAQTMTPEAAQSLIRERVKAGILRRAELKPYVLTRPVQLDIRFKHYRQAELLGYLSIVQRTTSHSIRFTTRDVLEASRFLAFVETYEAGMTP